jgi:hypothetical protein
MAPTVESAAIDQIGPAPTETAPAMDSKTAATASAVVQAERAADAAAAPRAITPVEMEDAESHRGRNILISLLIVLVVAAIVAAVVIAI